MVYELEWKDKDEEIEKYNYVFCKIFVKLILLILDKS